MFPASKKSQKSRARKVLWTIKLTIHFSGLEISVKKNTAFKILHQNEKSLKNLWKMHFSKKKKKKKNSKSKNDLSILKFSTFWIFFWTQKHQQRKLGKLLFYVEKQKCRRNASKTCFKMHSRVGSIWKSPNNYFLEMGARRGPGFQRIWSYEGLIYMENFVPCHKPRLQPYYNE